MLFPACMYIRGEKTRASYPERCKTREVGVKYCHKFSKSSEDFVRFFIFVHV